MRTLVTGAGAFLGSHIASELAAAGHEVLPATARPDGIDAVVHLVPDRVRLSLDRAIRLGARVFVFLSAVGADPESRRRQLAARGRAEEIVRASGMPWVVLRPEILWGPGDVFTNELAHLLRHLPFVPVPRGGRQLAPVYAGDVARALVELLDRPELWRRTWLLNGPEQLRYSDVVERVAAALRLRRRRPLRVPAWAVRIGAQVEERVARRPRQTRALLDRLVATGTNPTSGDTEEHQLALPKRLMTVEALEKYL